MNSWKPEELEALDTLYKQYGAAHTIISRELGSQGIQRSAASVETKIRNLYKKKVTLKTFTPKPVKRFVARLFNIPRSIIKVVALYDSHYPYHIDINPFLDFVKDFEPDEFIFGGDNWDVGVISHWNEKTFNNTGLHEVRKKLHEEAAGFRNQIDQIRGKCPKASVTYITGNHEDWVTQFEEHYPSFTTKEGLNFENLIGSRERQIQVIPRGGTYNVGKITFLHGDQFGGENPCKSALMRCHHTVVFGHFHSFKVWPAFSMVDAEDKFIAIQVPCYSHLAPKYLRGRPNEWQNGFFTATVRRSDGKFSPHVQLVSPRGHFMTQMGKEYK